MRRQGGFALLIVLLSMGLLALLAAWITRAGRTDSRVSLSLTEAEALQAAAEGAIVHAAFTAFAQGDPAFQAGPAIHRINVGGINVAVRLLNESDRVNLNTAPLTLLQALIVGVGAPREQAVRLAAAIVDWRTRGVVARANGAKAPQYRAAGLPYDPPETPFLSVNELQFVLGMTPALFNALAPHLTVWTDDDPDMSTHDPVVAQALADSTNGSPLLGSAGEGVDDVLRVTASASGPDGTLSILQEVVANDLRARPPRLRILFRRRCNTTAGSLFGSCQ